jgi:hypothetical protein
MNRSAKEIEREVEATRASVEETVEALKEKMTLGQMVDEAAGYFRSTGGPQLFSNLGSQVRDNPLPLALVGVGLVWLMSGRGRPHVRAHLHAGNGRRHQGYASPDYRLMAEQDEAVYAGASHPDFAGHSTGADDAWHDGGRSAEHRYGIGNGLRGKAHDIRDAAGSVAGGIAGAAGSVAGGIAGAASKVASGVGAAASTVGSAGSRIAGGARSGAGAAWRGGGSAYRGASRFGSSAYGYGSSAYEGATRYGSSAYEGAAGYGSSAYRGMSRFGSSAYDSASRMGYRARDTFSEVVDREPLVLGALGLAIGAAFAVLAPRTRTEDELIGETRDRFFADVEEYGREQFEHGKRMAEETYRTALKEAEAQGLTPSEIAAKLGDVARSTMDRARDSADDLYSSAKRDAKEQGLTPQGLADKVGSVAKATTDQARKSAEQQGFASSSSSGSTATTSPGTSTSQESRSA